MEEIYQQFTTLVGTTDLSPRTLNAIVDTVYSAEMTEEQVTAALEKGKVLALEAQGNLNKIIADKVKEATKKKPVETKKAKEDETDELSELKARLEQIAGTLAKQESDKALAKKRSELIAAAKKLGVEDNAFCVEAVELMNVSEQSDVDELAAKMVALYNKKASAEAETGGTPKRAAGGGSSLKKWEEKFKDLAPKE